VQQLLDARFYVRAYPTSFPDLAMDVDKQSDLPLVERVLRERGTPGGR
jgi:hypothetical protein